MLVGVFLITICNPFLGERKKHNKEVFSYLGLGFYFHVGLREVNLLDMTKVGP